MKKLLEWLAFTIITFLTIVLVIVIALEIYGIFISIAQYMDIDQGWAIVSIVILIISGVFAMLAIIE